MLSGTGRRGERQAAEDGNPGSFPLQFRLSQQSFENSRRRCRGRCDRHAGASRPSLRLQSCKRYAANGPEEYAVAARLSDCDYWPPAWKRRSQGLRSGDDAAARDRLHHGPRAGARGIVCSTEGPGHGQT